MCGIFAVLGLKGDATANRKRVYRLAKRIRHRGPDSYNIDVNVDDKAGGATDKRLQCSMCPTPETLSKVTRMSSLTTSSQCHGRFPLHRPPCSGVQPCVRVFPEARSLSYLLSY